LRAIPLVVGSDEILLSDAVLLAESACQAGVDTTLDVWENMWLVWHFFSGQTPEGRRAMNEVGNTLAVTWARPARPESAIEGNRVYPLAGSLRLQDWGRC